MIIISVVRSQPANEHQENYSVVFQPVVNLKTGEHFGYEAFSRPSSMFQKRNKKSLLGLDWQAFGICMHQAGLLYPEAKIFINIRPATLIWLYRNHQEICLPYANSLVIELTEGEKDGPIDVVKEVIAWFRKLTNCQIAIDDMGSGFNRLTYSSELKPDFLKIDRPLVKFCDKNPERRFVIKMIQELSEKLQANMIAEGIERIEEQDTLIDLGVTLGQGYLFGKPKENWEVRS